MKIIKNQKEFNKLKEVKKEEDIVKEIIDEWKDKWLITKTSKVWWEKMVYETYDKTMKKIEEEIDNELEDVNKKINEYLELFGKGKNRNINIGEKIVLTTLPEIITNELKQRLGLNEIQ